MMEKLFKDQTDSASVQAFRYILAGAMAYAIDYSTLIMLTNIFKLHYLTSAAIAFVLGATASYILNITWVFDGRIFKNKYLEVSVFFGIVITGLFLNHYCILFFTESAKLHYLISKFISTIAVGAFNFSARKFILFRYNISHFTVFYCPPLVKIELIGYTYYRNIGGDVSIAKAIRPITYKKTPEVKRSFLFILTLDMWVIDDTMIM